MLSHPVGVRTDFVGFPPGGSFVLLPSRPAQAAVAGLALYEAVEPRQRALLHVAQWAGNKGFLRWLPTVGPLPPTLAVQWWDSWISDVARAIVGDVDLVAFRVPPNGRTAALLLTSDGRPIGFAKILSSPPSALHRDLAAALRSDDLPFATPRVLDEGTHAGVAYRLYSPLPLGPHRRPPRQPDRVAAIIDAWQDHTAAVVAGAPHGGVVSHGDFTPRNIRVASDGQWWLIDWDNARRGPRLADELHYWCADYAWTARHNLARDANRIVALLRQRGSDDEIAQAAAWPDAPARTYRPRELDLRRAVGALAGQQT